MAERTGLAESQWHGEADRREHLLSGEEVDALAATMAYPRYDPHGDPIPTAAGEVGPLRGVALTTLAPGQSGVVAHVEDEPDVIYKQLTAQGFSVGCQLRVEEVTPHLIRVELDGEEQVLAPVVAANLSVVPTDREDRCEWPLRRLADVPPGRAARVVRISPACRGMQRRRLFDLGLIPGTVVRAEFRGPGGDPTAYDIRGARIALRREQAEQVVTTGDLSGSDPAATALLKAV
jgi:DtxR family Mn-dependent transcriptional regulator